MTIKKGWNREVGGWLFGWSSAKADALRCARRNNNQPENRNNNIGFRVVRRSNQDQIRRVNKVVTHDAGHLRMPGRQLIMTGSLLCPSRL